MLSFQAIGPFIKRGMEQSIMGWKRNSGKPLFFAVIWSIWNIRNRIVFEGVKPDWDLERRQMKLRWGFWIKSWLGKRKLGGDELCSNLLTLRKWRAQWRSIKG